MCGGVELHLKRLMTRREGVTVPRALSHNLLITKAEGGVVKGCGKGEGGCGRDVRTVKLGWGGGVGVGVIRGVGRVKVGAQRCVRRGVSCVCAEVCLVCAQRCVLCVRRGVSCVCAEVCLVCAQRCVLCVRRGVSCVCAEVCLVCAQRCVLCVRRGVSYVCTEMCTQRYALWG